MSYEEFKELIIKKIKEQKIYKPEDGDFNTWWKNRDGEYYTETAYKKRNLSWYKNGFEALANAASYNIYMS